MKLLPSLPTVQSAFSTANLYRKGIHKLIKQKGSIGKAYQEIRKGYMQNGMMEIKRILQHSLYHHAYYLTLPLDITSQHEDILRIHNNYVPLVSAIIPNFNHTKDLIERLDSITNQKYSNIELIILTDQPTDNVLKIIHNYFKYKPDIRYKLEINEKNSGNIFTQWKNGIELASGDLIWICEGNHTYSPDFLSNIMPYMARNSINLAFGNTQLVDNQGNHIEDREHLELGICENPCIKPAYSWFNSIFGINNVYVNARSGIFRRQQLAESIWKEASTFEICGDWYLYLHLANSGEIAYVPAAKSYLRQHQDNADESNFHQMHYYQEHLAILKHITDKWPVSEHIKEHFIDEIKKQYIVYKMDKIHGVFEETFSDKLSHTPKRKNLHIQQYFLGFHTGGGELFPIVLANQLHELGYIVSMVALDLSHINDDMYKKLNKSIPVYHISDLQNDPNFLEKCGVDLVHTHIIDADRILAKFLENHNIDIPYVVTMHGSHNHIFSRKNQEETKKILNYVSHWVYIADKNLDFFQNLSLPKIKKFPNAMPMDKRTSDNSRESLGIKENDIVFAFAARGIKEKGWEKLIHAFMAVQDETQRHDIHLILMGSGDAQKQAQILSSGRSNIHFLGYESAVNGVLRFSDCLILPSQFEGESYPLILIQAIQEHIPCIATDIGEIRNMIYKDEGNYAGILLENTADDEAFIWSIQVAIKKMLDENIRKKHQNITMQISYRYNMKELTDRYIKLYKDCIISSLPTKK